MQSVCAYTMDFVSAHKQKNQIKLKLFVAYRHFPSHLMQQKSFEIVGYSTWLNSDESHI